MDVHDCGAWLQAVLAARAKARGARPSAGAYADDWRPLALEHLVVDELVCLKKNVRMRARYFRGRGGVASIMTRRTKLSLRLREVPGATMQTRVLRPWFERRYRHRREHRGTQSAQLE